MKPAATVVIIFLLLLALVHLFRLVYGVEMIVNGQVVPVWFSLPPVILTSILAWFLWREQKK
jgi:hypothetical protein